MVARDGWVAVREPRGIVNVSRRIAPPGERVPSADVQRVPLIMVKKLEAVAKRKIREAAVNVPETLGELIRVGQVDLRAIANPR